MQGHPAAEGGAKGQRVPRDSRKAIASTTSATPSRLDESEPWQPVARDSTRARPAKAARLAAARAFACCRSPACSAALPQQVCASGIEASMPVAASSRSRPALAAARSRMRRSPRTGRFPPQDCPLVRARPAAAAVAAAAAGQPAASGGASDRPQVQGSTGPGSQAASAGPGPSRDLPFARIDWPGNPPAGLRRPLPPGKRFRSEGSPGNDPGAGRRSRSEPGFRPPAPSCRLCGLAGTRLRSRPGGRWGSAAGIARIARIGRPTPARTRSSGLPGRSFQPWLILTRGY